MKTSTGLMIILIAALLASASIPSPLRFSVGQEIGTPSRATSGYVRGRDLNRRWQATGESIFQLPQPGWLLQSWWSWQVEMFAGELLE